MCWVHFPKDTVWRIHVNWNVIFSVVLDDDVDVVKRWIWGIGVENVVGDYSRVIVEDPVCQVVERGFGEFDMIGEIFVVYCGGGPFFTDCFKSGRTVIMRFVSRQCCKVIELGLGWLKRSWLMPRA
jgi:hypothetical protein